MAAMRQLIVRYNGQLLMTSTVRGGRCTIGRREDSDLLLLDEAVADAHAEIRVEAGQAMLVDLGSESGTSLGGVRLAPNQPQRLPDGAMVSIGPYEITYRSAVDVPGESPAAPAPAVGTAAGGAATVEQETASLAARRQRPASLEVNGSGSRYVSFLPIIFHDNDFLARFLQIFETVWEPLERRQDHIHMYFSPKTCPASWLPWMASWFGLSIDPYLSEDQARGLLAEAVDVYRWRGTRRGLTRIIEVCLNVRPEIVERPEEPNVFRVIVTLPAGSGAETLSILRELVSTHKPAHMGYVVEVQ